MTKKQQPKSQYIQLRQKWLKRHKLAQKQFHKKHKVALDWVIEKFPFKDKIASSAIGVLMLSSIIPSSTVLGAITTKPNQAQETHRINSKEQLISQLSAVLPGQMRSLTQEEEQKIAQILSFNFNMPVNYQINGLRLNKTYGFIGAEQHLMRYPGDTMTTHLSAALQKDKMIYSSGMAPGRGAWGYFAKSREDLTQTDIEREKWYIAVQTFLAPNYNERLANYRDFFKYRKMLLVNPETGQAIVTDIADAGPATETGKHLGGSPEVIYYIGFGQGSRKGPVLYFFIDDPDDKIPLGPIEI